MIVIILNAGSGTRLGELTKNLPKGLLDINGKSLIERQIENFSSKNIDSIFTAKKFYSWFWFNNKPVNYKPKTLPRSQDAKPIIMETTGLYGIKSKALKLNKCRIGKKPYMYFAKNLNEALDIDNNEDLENFKLLLKKS